MYNWQSADPQADRLGADELISRALAIDSNNYFAHYARSLFLAPQRPDEAIVEAERALALNPSFLPAYISLWIANWTAGRTEKADEYLDAALRLRPHNSLAYIYLGEKGDGLFNQSRYEAATEFFKRAITVSPETVTSYFRLAASLALSGHDAEAREALRRYLALPLDIPKTIAQFKARQPYDTPICAAITTAFMKACARRGCRRSERDPENCGDPGRRRGRLQPARAARTRIARWRGCGRCAAI